MQKVASELALQKAKLVEAKLAESQPAAQRADSELKSHKAEIAKVQIQQLPYFTMYMH